MAYTFYETDNRVKRYARTLVERGDEVEAIVLRRPGQSWSGAEHGVRLVRLQRRSKTERTPAAHLAKILWFLVQALLLLGVRHIRRRYDIIHVHNLPNFLVFAALVPRLMGASVLLDIHDAEPELYGYKFGCSSGSTIYRCLLFAERMSCRFASHVIVANHLWHARLVARSVKAEKCSAILNYPDLRMFRPSDKPDGAGTRFLILYPGTLSPHQGVHVAIRAFASVRARMPNARFHVYGEGPARAELIALSESLRSGDCITFFDPLPVEDLAEVMSGADLGVEPKLSEGFSNEALSTKILEFMAVGVPVLVSRTLVHSQYFGDDLVRFFPPGDEEALAAALVEAYENGPDKSSVRRAAAFAEQNSWQRRRGDYLGLVDRLCGAA